MLMHVPKVFLVRQQLGRPIPPHRVRVVLPRERAVKRRPAPGGTQGTSGAGAPNTRPVLTRHGDAMR